MYLSLSSDGKYIVIAHGIKQQKIWELSSGTLVHTLEGMRWCKSASRSDGKYIVTGSRDNTAKIWEVSRVYCLTLEGMRMMWVVLVSVPW